MAPGLCLIAEAGVETASLGARTAHPMLEQMSDPALQDGICGQADRILAALRFSGTVDLPVKRAALEQDCAASRWSGHGRPPAPMQRASPRRSGHFRGARTRKADAGAAIV